MQQVDGNLVVVAGIQTDRVVLVLVEELVVAPPILCVVHASATGAAVDVVHRGRWPLAGRDFDFDGAVLKVFAGDECQSGPSEVAKDGEVNIELQRVVRTV